MEPSISLKSVIILLGAAHGLFLALAIVNVKSGNTTANRFLALVTLAFAVDLGGEFLFQSRYLVQMPRIYFLDPIVNFLYGPLIYLYIDALTSQDGFRFSNSKSLHFLPFALSIVLLVPFFQLSNEQILGLIYLDADVENISVLSALGGLLVQFLPAILIGVYMILGIRRLIRHGWTIRDKFSSIERINLTWLRNMLIGLSGLYVIYVVGTVLSDMLDIGEEIHDTQYFLIVIVIYTMGYLGLRQPEIFSQENFDPALDDRQRSNTGERPEEQEKKKYQRSALAPEMSGLLLRELQDHMAAERPYLDPGLTLSQLADQLQISRNYLSQVINEQTGSNFFDFINKHRVDAAKELLADSAGTKTNILAVAMDAGFNSKSAFYTAFKQHAEMTPSQYRKSHTNQP